MKNPRTTYAALVDFADWVARQPRVLSGKCSSPVDKSYDHIIRRARHLTGEAPREGCPLFINPENGEWAKRNPQE